jgi:restriction system protein
LERAARFAEREAAAEEKDKRRFHAETRQNDVDMQNEELEEQTSTLRSLLQATLDVDDYVSFESFKEVSVPRPFSPGPLGIPEPAPELGSHLPPTRHGLRRLIATSKGKNLERERAEREYAAALEAHTRREDERRERLAQAKSAYDDREARAGAELRQQHSEIDDLHRRFESGEPGAVESYFSRVLEASSYPSSLPRANRLAYLPESRQLVVESELPSLEAIPSVRGYKYLKTKDEITATPLPVPQRKSLYTSVVAQMSLRTVHELFEADRTNKLDTIVFNGLVTGADKRTGNRARVCLVTLRTTRDVFGSLDLMNVDPQECLRGLSAGFSRNAAEMAPVRPVLEFNMVDPRFVEESDVLSGLDERPNLMMLTPSQFESLITNLFEKMGLETRLTQASRDGGVDCVAYDPRPILGGRVVIQAKRYKNTVGVSAVRDLFGTMQNEGASKGILVTTSGYGKASFEFAAGKPLELLEGSHLLYLLKEHADIDAKIVVPEDWVDASPMM